MKSSLGPHLDSLFTFPLPLFWFALHPLFLSTCFGSLQIFILYYRLAFPLSVSADRPLFVPFRSPHCFWALAGRILAPFVCLCPRRCRARLINARPDCFICITSRAPLSSAPSVVRQCRCCWGRNTRSLLYDQSAGRRCRGGLRPTTTTARNPGSPCASACCPTPGALTASLVGDLRRD